jgi:hypothetical protein
MSNKRYRLKSTKEELIEIKQPVVVKGVVWQMFMRKDHDGIPFTLGSDEIEEIKVPERIEVSRLFFECHEPNQMCSYCFEMNGTIPIEKHKAVKKAIEDVLNFKDEINYVPLTKVVQDFISKQYTEDDLKDAMAYVGDLAAKHYTNDSWKQNWFNQWKSQRK